MSKNRFLFLIFMFCLLQTGYSQYTLDIMRPNEFALKSADLWNCVINNSGNEKPNVFLYGILSEEKKGKLLEIESGRFALANGITMFNTSNYDALKNEKVLYSDKTFEDHIFRTNSLPNGAYTLCITLVREGSLQQLATSCIDIDVNKMTSMNLILPYDQDSICEQNMMFLWMPISQENSIISSYTLNIYEVLKHQTPIAATLKNAPFYIEKNISSTQFQVPNMIVPFKDKSQYAWQITAFDDKNRVLTRSEVWSFYNKNCMGADGLTETVEDGTPPKPIKKKQKLVSYFSIYDKYNAHAVYVNADTLRVLYPTFLNEEKVFCQIFDGNGKSIFSEEKSVNDASNLLVFPFAQIKAIPDQNYTMEITNRVGKRKFLKFKRLKVVPKPNGK